MALKHFISEAARLRLNDLTEQQKKIQIEVAEILTRETDGMELDALEQQELRAVQMIAEAYRSGSVEQWISENTMGAREVSATMSSVAINLCANASPEAGTPAPITDEWPETLPRTDES